MFTSVFGYFDPFGVYRGGIFGVKISNFGPKSRSGAVPSAEKCEFEFCGLGGGVTAVQGRETVKFAISA